MRQAALIASFFDELMRRLPFTLEHWLRALVVRDPRHGVRELDSAA